MKVIQNKMFLGLMGFMGVMMGVNAFADSGCKNFTGSYYSGNMSLLISQNGCTSVTVTKIIPGLGPVVTEYKGPLIVDSDGGNLVPGGKFKGSNTYYIDQSGFGETEQWYEFERPRYQVTSDNFRLDENGNLVETEVMQDSTPQGEGPAEITVWSNTVQLSTSQSQK